MLNITMNEAGGAAVILLEGHLDTVTAPDLEAVLNDCCPAADSLVLDFAGVDYISSSGLRVLLTAHKAMANKGGLKLIHANGMIREIFDMTGFSGILTIE